MHGCVVRLLLSRLQVMNVSKKCFCSCRCYGTIHDILQGGIWTLRSSCFFLPFYPFPDLFLKNTRTWIVQHVFSSLAWRHPLTWSKRYVTIQAWHKKHSRAFQCSHGANLLRLSKRFSSLLLYQSNNTITLSSLLS